MPPPSILETGDAHARGEAVQAGEPVRAGGGDHVAPGRAGAHARGPLSGLDGDAVHARGADQHQVASREPTEAAP